MICKTQIYFFLCIWPVLYHAYHMLAGVPCISHAYRNIMHIICLQEYHVYLIPAGVSCYISYACRSTMHINTKTVPYQHQVIHIFLIHQPLAVQHQMLRNCQISGFDHLSTVLLWGISTLTDSTQMIGHI